MNAEELKIRVSNIKAQCHLASQVGLKMMQSPVLERDSADLLVHTLQKALAGAMAIQSEARGCPVPKPEREKS